MDYLKVEGHDNLYRDPQTNSIVTMDNTGYDEYISRRNTSQKVGSPCKGRFFERLAPLQGTLTVLIVN